MEHPHAASHSFSCLNTSGTNASSHQWKQIPIHLVPMRDVLFQVERPFARWKSHALFKSYYNGRNDFYFGGVPPSPPRLGKVVNIFPNFRPRSLSVCRSSRCVPFDFTTWTTPTNCDLLSRDAHSIPIAQTLSCFLTLSNHFLTSNMHPKMAPGWRGHRQDLR